MRTDLSALSISYRVKHVAATGLDEGIAETKSEMESLWNLQEDIFTKCEDIIELLSRRNGSWKIVENKILFQTQIDLDEFNDSISKITTLSLEQSSIQDRLRYRSMNMVTNPNG